MTTKITKLKDLQISKKDSKNLKGGYADTGFGGGTGSTGFIIWDDLDPRDNGFAFSAIALSMKPAKFKEK